MRWTPGYRSRDVVDRRGEPQRGVGMRGLGPLLYFLPILLRSPLGWLVLIAIGVGYLFFTFGRGVTGVDHARHAAPEHAGGAEADHQAEFVGFVLDDAQDTWANSFAQSGLPYERAKLVLFTDATPTACGYGTSATGPFYCPLDKRIYLDLGFFHDLSQRLGAGGDFAQAYVVAHEVGHHVQNLLGLTERTQVPRALREGPKGASVRLELQADCLAGVWAHATKERNLLEKGDVEEALAAASAVGDDRMQRRATGTVTPDSFTHGTSEQRSHWFRRGLEAGTMQACDTFGAGDL
jgi:predicted metalloprotease